MTKGEKQALVQELVTQLKGRKAAVITEYRGTSVAQMEKIRTELFKQGINYRVAKNSLLKRAVQEAGILEPDSGILDLPIALAVGNHDEVTVAKVLTQIGKDFETIVPVGGIVDGQFVDAGVVSRLAKLPGREELLVKLVSRLASLPTKMVRTINNPLQGLINALVAIKDQFPSNLESTKEV